VVAKQSAKAQSLTSPGRLAPRSSDDPDAIQVIIETPKGSRNRTRNDRIVAVKEENHSYAHVKHINDLGKEFVEELEEFFVNYHELSGKKYRILDVRGPREARRRIESGVREARNG